MTLVGAALAIGFQAAIREQPFPIQFVGSLCGESVRMSIDGKRPKTTFAGKLGIRDGSGAEQVSCCANVRGPVAPGMKFLVKPLLTSKLGGGVRLAGNIVAGAFATAKSEAQCAGLQLAIWEAIEDGGTAPNFAAGRFRAEGSAAALAWAEEFYQAAGVPGDSTLLWQGSGNGQSQIYPTKV